MKRARFVFRLPEVEEDPRTPGMVRFADPSTGTMTSRVHTFNEPESRGVGEQHGTRSIQPWSNDESLWRNMNHRRGLKEDEDNDFDG